MKRTCPIVLIALLAVAAFGQTTPDEGNILKMLEQSKLYYNSGEYERAIAELERALNVLYKLKQNDRVEAYKYLGFSYVAFGDVVKAKESFKRALSINPDLKLDPATVSPKIIQIFEQARLEMPKTVVGDTTPEEPTLAKVDYTGATFRSMLIPGWGQMHKGETGKGRVIMISALTSLSGAVLFALLEAEAHKAYNEDYSKYGRYNFMFNMTRICLVGFAGSWLFGVVDAALVRPRTQTSLGDGERGSDLGRGPGQGPLGEKFSVGVRMPF